MIIKTSDNQIIELKQTTVDINSYIKKKSELEAQLRQLPALKIEPDKETLELYNAFISKQIEIQNSIQRQIEFYDTKIKELLEVEKTTAIDVTKTITDAIASAKIGE